MSNKFKILSLVLCGVAGAFASLKEVVMRSFILVVSLLLLAFALCFGQADSLNMRRIGTWIAPDTVGF